jgi:hypothetical protein
MVRLQLVVCETFEQEVDDSKVDAFSVKGYDR